MDIEENKKILYQLGIAVECTDNLTEKMFDYIFHNIPFNRKEVVKKRTVKWPKTILN